MRLDFECEKKKAEDVSSTFGLKYVDCDPLFSFDPQVIKIVNLLQNVFFSRQLDFASLLKNVATHMDKIKGKRAKKNYFNFIMDKASDFSFSRFDQLLFNKVSNNSEPPQ